MVRLLVTTLAVSAAAPVAAARAQGELPPLVVIVEAPEAGAADRVRAALGRALSRVVVSLDAIDETADPPTVVSIVLWAGRAAMTVLVPGGPHATRTVELTEGTVVSHAAALVREVEADVRTQSGLASWSGGDARAIRVLSPGLLPWPGDEAVRREATRRGSSAAEDGDGLSAPPPRR